MAQISKRYELGDKLGQGGMGMVFQALDRLTGQVVALKRVLASADSLIFSTRGDTPNLRQALAREFQILAGLRHPHIVSVLDYGFDEQGQAFFTMELLPKAKPFMEAVAPLDIDEKLRLLGQLLQALDYLHRRGILHRDLKPGNVLVAGGVVKVLDFGLAIPLQDIQNSTDPVGTITYMAPELLNRQPASVASDLYAFGVMAYQVFAGKSPFQSTLLFQLMQDILGTKPDITPLLNISTRSPAKNAPDDDVTQVLPPSSRGRRFSTENPAPGDDQTTVVDTENLSGAGSTPAPASPQASTYSPLAEYILRLLDKSPQNRPQSAKEALDGLYEVFGQKPPVIRGAALESVLQAATFIGREAELLDLSAAYVKAQSGQGALVLVGGESGVGKSRLLEEMRILALMGGGQVARGQAVEGGGLPFQLWRQALPPLLLTLGDALSDFEAGVLKEILPEIANLLGRPIPDAPPLAGAASNERLVLAIAEVLSRQTQATLLLLEDLHWSSESLSPLKLLMERLPQLPLLVIGSYRDDETPDLPGQFPEAQVLSLPRLSHEAIAQLSQAILGPVGAQAELVNLLEKETEGNTFFMVEAVRALADLAGSLFEVGQQPLPKDIFTGGMQALLNRRLSRIPAEDWGLLRLSAVAGRALDLKVLARLASEDRLQDWLYTCQAAAVLSVEGQAWQFAHDKLRAAILSDIPTEALGPLHGEVAQALEQAYPSDKTYHAPLLEHWTAAQNREKELFYLPMVAEYYIRTLGQYPAAKRVLDHGLGHLAAEAAQRPRLLNLSSHIQMAWGDYAQARIIVEEALALAQAQNLVADQTESLRTLGMLATNRGQVAAAADHYQEGIRLARNLENTAPLVSLLIQATVTYLAQTELALARQMIEEAAPLAQNLGLNHYSSDVSVAFGRLAILEGRPAEALPHFQRAVQITEGDGDQQGLGFALINLGRAEMALANYATAEAHFERAGQILSRIGNRRGIGLVQLYQAELETLVAPKTAGPMIKVALSAIHALKLHFPSLMLIAMSVRVYYALGQLETVAQVLGFLAPHSTGDIQKLIEPGASQAEQSLGPEVWQQAQNQGQGLLMEQVIERILGDFAV